MLSLVVWTQAFFLDIILAVGEMQPVFGGKHLADFLIAVKVVLVADGLAVIVHTVENDVAVWMLPVGMSGYNVLSIDYSYLHHVVTGYLQHERIVMV